LPRSRDLLTPDFVFTGPGNRAGVHGQDAFAALQEGFRTALADLRFDLVGAIVDADGERAALTLRMRGRQQASFLGVAPAGARVDLSLVDIVRFQRQSDRRDHRLPRRTGPSAAAGGLALDPDAFRCR